MIVVKVLYGVNDMEMQIKDIDRYSISLFAYLNIYTNLYL